MGEEFDDVSIDTPDVDTSDIESTESFDDAGDISEDIPMDFPEDIEEDPDVSDSDDVYHAIPNSEIPILQEDGSVVSLADAQAELEAEELDDIEVETYHAIPNSEIPILQEDGSITSLADAQAELEAEEPNDIEEDVYHAVPNSEIPILQEDGSITSLADAQAEIDEFPEDAEELPENTDELPEETDDFPEDAGEVSEDTDELPEEMDDFPEDMEEVPEDTDELPEETDDFPEDTEELPEEQQETLDEQPETLDEQTEVADEQPETAYEQPEAAEEQLEAPEEQKDEFDRVLDRVMDSDLSPEHKKQILEDMKAEMLVQQGNSEIGDYSEEFAEYSDEDDADEGPVLTLKRDDQELLDAGARDIERVLEAKEFDYRDKGLDEEEIAQRLEEDRRELEQQFLQDAFPGRDVHFNHEHRPVQGNKDISKISDVENWLGDINPNFDAFDPESPYCNNCGSCAYAVYQRLEGNTDSCASAENIGYNSEMEALTGMEQISMSPDEIQRRLLEQGDGAHAIIGIDRAEGPGHWFNAACIDGKVVAIDGQTGEITDWPPDYGDVVNWEMSVKKEDK